ncbi:MAG: hypothetical protein BIFFINMI_03187 [Phycisphaerae bacterium]|nr:hypothetical protein [Phycisphaerae bacterium]
MSHKLPRCLPSMAALLVTAALAADADARVWLDYDFGEGMVLQAGVKTALHGAAGRGETVTLTFRGRTVQTTADKITGQWQIELDPGDAGGPLAMTIAGGEASPKGPNSIELKNVTVAEIALDQVLGDGMVLQRGGKAPVFGTARPGDEVSVDFRSRTFSGKADDRGRWRVDVDPGQAGGPFPMNVHGRSDILLKEVYVGEVWLCSGQSNMRWGTCYTGKDWGETALRLRGRGASQQLRLQRFPQDETGYASNHPPKRFLGWQAADEKSVGAFSGTGYYFGEALQSELKVPLGLIQSAVDATGIRGWTPADKLKEIKGGGPSDDIYYQRQIKPAMPFAIRGIIWYQGEADTGKDPFGVSYDRRLTALIDGWRHDWGRGDIPFIYVQLARIGFGAEQIHRGELPSLEQRKIVDGWARVRDEQRRVLAEPATAMVVCYDLTTGMLHPPQKKPIGARLAVAARALAYGEKIEYSGPILESAKRDGDQVVLSFSHADGLAAEGYGGPRQLEAKAAGAEEFVAVPARIKGNAVLLDVKGLAGPLSIRYAYREWPDGNLVNAARLPASPFQVEDVK